MELEFSNSWALWLLLPFLAAVLWTDRRYRFKKPSLKRKVTLGARLALVTVLVLALAAPWASVVGEQTARWILLDVSDSASPSRAEMEQAVSEALRALPAGEKAGVIAFGSGAMVETPLSMEPVFSGSHTAVAGDHSQLSDGLLLAGALLPSDAGGSVLVVTDGRAEADTTAIGLLAARGVNVDVLAFPGQTGADAQISQLSAPAEVYEGQKISMEVVIDANAAMEGDLALLQNGVLTDSRKVSLNPGENRYAFTQTASAAGVVTYEAVLTAREDRESRNNRAAAYVRVNGAPNLLVITQSDLITGLFQAAGMKLTTLRPSEMFQTAEEYLAYDGVLLNNVDYDSASQSQWQALDSAVRTLGRGLCVLGGDCSYALGGYRGTLLEGLLPVRMDVKNKLRLPSLSLMIAIDKSGSMTAGQFGTSRIEVAKEAAMSALEVLTQRDSIGVIGFDDTAKWVVPFQRATDPAAIQKQIGTLRADGGTAFYSALEQSLETLSKADTAQKHMILLSDGQPGDTGFEALASAMRQAGITLTTVAVGNDADVRLMRRLASLGGGRSYQADEFSNVPKIFAKETMLAGGSYVQNRVFTPVITENSALTDFEGFPELTGYLTATAKEEATVSMISDQEDPLLARWNAGAGKVLCWLSDGEGAWTEKYLRWDQASAFFGGMAAAVLPGGERDGVLTAQINEGEMSLRYTAEAEGNPQTQATIVSPDGTEQTISLWQSDVNTWEGKAKAEQQGAYALRVVQNNGREGTRIQESGAVKGFSQEYDLRDTSGVNLESLAFKTGGRMLSSQDPLWISPSHPQKARKNMQTGLLMLAMALLLADIALRKVSWDEAVAGWLEKRRETQKGKAVREEATQRGKPSPSRENKGKAQGQNAVSTASALLEARKARKGE